MSAKRSRGWRGAAEGGGGGRQTGWPAADGLLCPPAVPLGTVVVPGDSDLELCRAHIERLQQVRGRAPALPGPTRSSFCSLPTPALGFSRQEPEGAGAKSPTCQKLSPKWCFLDGEWPRRTSSWWSRAVSCPLPQGSWWGGGLSGRG